MRFSVNFVELMTSMTLKLAQLETETVTPCQAKFPF